MIKPAQVMFKGMDASPALEADILKKIERLERHAPRLQSCRVVVEAPPKHQSHGGLFRVVLDVTLPGREIVVGKDGDADHAHEDPRVAVRDAFRAMERRIQDESDRA